MAVDAHHLLLHPGGGKKLAAWEGGGALCSDTVAPAGRHGGCYYGAADAAAAVLLGRQQSRHQQLLPPPPPSQGYQLQQPSPYAAGMVPAATVGQYGGQVSASESGVTFGGAQDVVAVMPSRKRTRRAADEQQVLGLSGGVAAQLQQQLVDVDRIVLQHTSNMWAELAEHRRRHARQVAAAAEAEAARRVRAKDEEIARLARLNWTLEERVRGLLVEAQVWRDLAQSNEATANALRVELQQALDAQARRGVAVLGAPDAADDAASCCCGENDVGAGAAGEEEEVGTATTSGSGKRMRRSCAVCGAGAAEVLLLPCRHLCACGPCADAARACPACGCAKNGSVRVNFS